MTTDLVPDGAAVWVVIAWERRGDPELCGVFGSEPAAVAACRTEYHAVYPATVGADLGEQSITWPGAWYPLVDPRPEPPA